MSIKLALAVAPENALMSAFVVFRDKLEISMYKAAKLGFDGVELALLNKKQVDLPNVKRMMKETGLEIPMVSTGQIFADTGVNFTHPEKEKREKALADFLGLMEVASELGSLINVGRLRGTLNEGSPSLDYFNESMTKALKRSEELGVTIALEPVNRYEINFLNSCAETAEAIRNLDHPNLTMMPDVFHMNIEDPSIEGSLGKYADLISYVHFADSNRWAPGRGHLDFQSIITALKTSGFDGYASLEILPYPEPDQAAAEAINTIRKFI
ncbi:MULTISPECIES: sugar phosphate isomerase/epimerase family protein [unclassified Oceanispirochaeta]|uniref:sugar phosphate isomerase/epimerase family protein n=1 Tax=unclassified Oceanispirochaeta TaxID=2635722 RepID=UPI000E099159|nr:MULTISPECIES: sugar phosphate isomerase/epimerase family protein [unclassified Oceanispirochaeta]MBF9018369.1 sugar phosphate isomerase/epimerase [Oceanispirochaeta sp. M2]NPD74827.1 sugar phosphate isomerase/epimerase [Oceanispirochaeta sp. M1]RDG29320.1 sugar phosphate isomerase/epimerase [Oceanispirochaeta sp. M1]